ncbi:protein ECERIFERUM 26-like [Miscanthus floridulus]|uniref:protein ECERIFERUM 26-like n=1 Tax=Miscanthus floridulus TaxID=154761 RepID=UPI003457F489
MVAEAVSRSPPLAVGGVAGSRSSMAVHGHRLSTVVPIVTGEEVNYELAGADLLHKLHYLRAVHVFRAPAFAIEKLKEPMFPWLDLYFPVSGRLRRRQAADADGDAEDGKDGDAAVGLGRPYVRCNDCGVRIVEVACDATVEQWLEAEAERGGLCKALAYDKVIGPEFFSPLLYVQVCTFKCGGMALGFTWAHVIGDIPSDAACFSKWAQLFSGQKAPAPTLRDPLAMPPSAAPPASVAAPPPSVKATATPVGDHWAVPTTHDMVPFSSHVTEQQLQGVLQLSAPKGHHQRHVVGPFELVSALMWRALAAIRGPEEEEATRTVTVVKTEPAGCRLALTNEHRIGHVVVAATGGSSPATADVAELAALLAGAHLEEASAVAAAAFAGAEGEDADVVMYGANLTFVDAEGLEVYAGLELAGRRPAHVEYAVDGGAAVVHRDAGGRGRTVAAVLRRGEADRLRAAIRDALRVAA